MSSEAIIREALAAYGMADAEYQLIRQNENLTSKVTNQGKCYSLRIHKQAEGFSTSLFANGRNAVELFRSEIALLNYMDKNGFTGLQRPVRNLQGAYVTVLHSGIPAMLLTWVDGDPMKKEDYGRYAESLGELACKIHKAAQGFSDDRPRYDSALSDRMIREINAAVCEGHIPSEMGTVCIRELEAVKRVQELHKDNSTLLHADLGLGNILVTEKGLIPIDFSLSGYGCAAQEAGMILSNYPDDESCRRVLEGFANCGVSIDPTEADIFLSYSVLLFICAQHRKVYTEDWFAGALERWCRKLFIHK